MSFTPEASSAQGAASFLGTRGMVSGLDDTQIPFAWNSQKPTQGTSQLLLPVSRHQKPVKSRTLCSPETGRMQVSSVQNQRTEESQPELSLCALY